MVIKSLIKNYTIKKIINKISVPHKSLYNTQERTAQ